MKRHFLGFFSALVIIAGCDFHHVSVSTSNTGCKGEGTRASSEEYFKRQQLSLKATSAGLVITHLNGQFNCSIKNYPVAVTINKEGNDLRVNADVVPEANCICLVERVEMVVEGLVKGEEYTLYYNYFLPIQFRYDKDLNLTLNLSDYAPV